MINSFFKFPDFVYSFSPNIVGNMNVVFMCLFFFFIENDILIF